MTSALTRIVAIDSDGFLNRRCGNFRRTTSFLAAVVFLAGALGGSTARAQSTARLSNISSRAQVGTGSNILIAGFVVGGSGTETLLVRGVGPGLAQFGLTGILAQLSLSVFDSNGTLIASNTGWGTSSNPTLIASTAAAVGAFAFAPGSADSAVIVSLPPGAYTAQVSGVNNTTGIALVEVYEVASSGTRLSNFSVRAQVGTGPNIVISGFVVTGSGSEGVLVRADGPALSQLGVTGVLALPRLNVFNGAGGLVASDTGWNPILPPPDGSNVVTTVVAGTVTTSSPSIVAAVSAVVGAFPLIPGSADSAVYTSLAPGGYTMQVSGQFNTTGIALLEVYEGPPPVVTAPVLVPTPRSPGSG